MELETCSTYKVIEIITNESEQMIRTYRSMEGEQEKICEYINEFVRILRNFTVIPCNLEFRLSDEFYIVLIHAGLYIENKAGKLSNKTHIANVYSLSRDGKVTLLEQRPNALLSKEKIDPILLDLTEDGELTVESHRLLEISKIKEKIDEYVSDRKCNATYGHNQEMYTDIQKELSDYFKPKLKSVKLFDLVRKSITS